MRGRAKKEIPTLAAAGRPFLNGNSHFEPEKRFFWAFISLFHSFIPTKAKSLKNFVLILLFGTALWLLTKYSAATSLSVRPKGVSFDGNNLFLTLGVFNSSPFPVSFNSFSGSISANGVPLSGVFDFVPVVVAPGIETNVNVGLTPNINNIVQLVKNIFNSGTDQELTLNGTLQAENLTLPINTVFQTIPAV